MKGKYLLLGTNLGDRQQNLDQARNWINKKIGELILSSSIYETAPWGITGQPPYLNQVVRIETGMSPNDLLIELLDIERTMGRKRYKKWDSRLIDLDILFYEDLIINEKHLIIPHPEIPNRRFTLVPLAEIAGSEVHPVHKISITKLLKETPDKLKAIKFPVQNVNSEGKGIVD